MGVLVSHAFVGKSLERYVIWRVAGRALGPQLSAANSVPQGARLGDHLPFHNRARDGAASLPRRYSGDSGGAETLWAGTFYAVGPFTSSASEVACLGGSMVPSL